MDFSKIENLAISGGGVKIINEVGVISVLEERGLLNQFKRFAGTSAGSIVACMLSLGYTAAELKQMAFELDFKKFEDGGLGEKLNVLRDYGWHTGNEFLKFIQQKIEAKTGSKYTTFAGLYANRFKDLTVFATCLNDCSLKVFNYELTPNVAVASAIRCSMSIPYFFEPHYIVNDLNTYVDGGAMLNYPLNYFPEENTIGICFNPFEKTPPVKLEKGEFLNYNKLLLTCLTDSQATNLAKNKYDLSRSIIIDSAGVSAVDFDVTPEQKQLMFDSGVKAAEKFLS